MSTECQTCGEEWPEEILVETELVDEEANEVVAKKICPDCLEDYEQNNWELEQAKVFEPRVVISPHLYMGCFNG